MLAPIICQKSNQRFVENTDGKLQNTQKIFTAPGPAVAQQNVVLLLDADASEAAEDVKVVGEVLELDQVDFPGARLLFADGF